MVKLKVYNIIRLDIDETMSEFILQDNYKYALYYYLYDDLKLTLKVMWWQMQHVICRKPTNFKRQEENMPWDQQRSNTGILARG